MATLKARFVQRVRKRFVCDWCERSITGACIYLYGSSETSEKPFAVRLHVHCLHSDCNDPKIKSALDMAQQVYIDIQELNVGRVQ